MSTIAQRLREHLVAIYGDSSVLGSIDEWANRIIQEAAIDESQLVPIKHRDLWSETDIALITYGDSILDGKTKPLKVLHRFLTQRFGQLISWLHLLPFHPWTSDDGFSVLDYSSINDALGDWSDITRLGVDYRLMTDLVLNHCSSRSAWFENFRRGVDPGRDYFFVPEPEFDVSGVVRPRTTPLFISFKTNEGDRPVWCTFGPDQVDFNFKNPAVLIEFITIIRQLLDAGVRVFRLDAVAFLWKESSTTCINLPQTHELIKLIRCVVECAQADAIIITETNVPNRENLSYFGDNDEAHGIYNFSLPPLLLHALVMGSSEYLSTWMKTMPPAQEGTVYFNFVASHDGIGLRPLEGLLDQSEVDSLLSLMQSFGAKISRRETNHGKSRPYEINISLLDALQGTKNGPDKFGVERFVCAHAVMLGLEGIPAFYIHSLLGTHNDNERYEHTSQNRSINRHQWSLAKLQLLLDDVDSINYKVLGRLRQLIEIRKLQPAFHPNATQFTLQLGNELFGFWRQSLDRRQSLFCIYNLTSTTQILPLLRLNLLLNNTWRELISETYLDESSLTWELSPYQTLWITNC